jgi:hypothetical protein
MFTNIFNKISAFFKNTFTSSDILTTALKREIIYSRYNSLFSDLKKAKELTQLVTLRKEIQEFKQLTIDRGEEVWARSYVISLVKIWNIKYKSWKGR